MSKFTDALDDFIRVAESIFNYDVDPIYKRITVNLPNGFEPERFLPLITYRGFDIVHRWSMREDGFRLVTPETPIKSEHDLDVYHAYGKLDVEWDIEDYEHES